ncbi:hypothetical protein, partial [Porphyrobacter sp. AAP82]|uniref:hypothetical protein n=1 Tax=Porphyrobacter sp. AAP82 TaxID=1248917 RepID=UPI001F30672E
MLGEQPARAEADVGQRRAAGGTAEAFDTADRRAGHRHPRAAGTQDIVGKLAPSQRAARAEARIEAADVTPSFPPAWIRVWRLFCASAR